MNEIINRAMNELINVIKSLSKNDRRELARVLRQTPEAWNAAYGIGNSTTDLANGNLRGLIVRDNKLEKDVKVTATKVVEEATESSPPSQGAPKIAASDPSGEESYTAISDVGGLFQFDIPTGKYNLSFVKDGLDTVTFENQYVITEGTNTLNVEMFTTVVV